MTRRGPSLVAGLVSLLIILSTLAFGAVYAWAYLPLFLSATCIGFGGIVHRGGIPHELRPLSIGLAIIATAIAVQLLPLGPHVLALVSPLAPAILANYAIGFPAASRHALSIDPEATERGLAVALVLALYTIGLSRVLTRRGVRALANTLTVFGVVLAIIGIYFREHNNGLVFGFWQPQESVIADSFGPFVNRNHFAGWMLMTTGLTTGVLFGRVERAQGRVGREFRQRIVWLSSRDASVIGLLVVSLVVMVVALAWTLSRSGILSLCVAAFVFAWLISRRDAGSRAQRALGIALVATVLFVGLSWRGFDRLIVWFSDPRDFEGRLGAWRDGWQVIRDFPLTGTGINTYRVAMIFYQRHNLDFWMSHAHNDYLQLFAEGGFLVSIPLTVGVALFARTVRARFQHVRGDSSAYWIRAGACVGLLAIAVQEMVEFSLHIPANMFLFATVAAIAVAPPADS